MAKQLSLTNLKRYQRMSCGGGTSAAHQKYERPLSSKKWIHLVFKSERAKGKWSFLAHHNKIWIKQLIKDKARQYGVTVGDYANVGNHIHLKVRITQRRLFQSFLKAVTGMIARYVTKARKGNPIGRFWQGLPFTRVLKSALEELRLRGYIQANRVEAKYGSNVKNEFLFSYRKWVGNLSSG